MTIATMIPRRRSVRAYRAERIVRLYGDSEKSPQKRLEEKDKRRRINYQRYTGGTWGLAQNYDLCLNSSNLGEERCVQMSIDAYKEVK